MQRRGGPGVVGSLTGLRVFEVQMRGGVGGEGGGRGGGLGLGRGVGAGGGCKVLHGRKGGLSGRRPDPGLLAPDASRQEAEANLDQWSSCPEALTVENDASSEATDAPERERSPRFWGEFRLDEVSGRFV